MLEARAFGSSPIWIMRSRAASTESAGLTMLYEPEPTRIGG
jgi:hypothetical protein